MDNHAHRVHHVSVPPLQHVGKARKGYREKSAPLSLHPLRESEIFALLSADGKGQINIPCGSASEIEEFRLTLLRLEKKGLVSRCEGAAFYRPFILTVHGLSARSLSPCNVIPFPATADGKNGGADLKLEIKLPKQ